MEEKDSHKKLLMAVRRVLETSFVDGIGRTVFSQQTCLEFYDSGECKTRKFPKDQSNKVEE